MYGDGDEDVYGGEERRQLRAETVSCSSTAELPSEHSSRSTRSPFVFHPVPASHQPTTEPNNQTRARRPASGLRLRDVYNCEYTYIRTSNMYNVIKERKEKERRRERGRERRHMYDYVYDGNDRNDTMRGIHGFTSRQR